MNVLIKQHENNLVEMNILCLNIFCHHIGKNITKANTKNKQFSLVKLRQLLTAKGQFTRLCA